jgi:F0F1-type ATP synthase membrane subunit a
VHTVNEVLALLTLVVGLLMVRIITVTNWDVLTSRVFLKKEEFQQFLRRFVYLILAFAAFIGISNLIPIFDINDVIVRIGSVHVPLHWIADLSNTLAMAFILLATTFLYRFLRRVEVQTEKGEGSL